MEEGRGDRRTSDGGGGATGESKRNAGGGGRGRHGGGWLSVQLLCFKLTAMRQTDEITSLNCSF